MYLIFITLSLLIGSSDSSAQVALTRIDGSSITGALSEWNEQSVAVATTAGEVRVATDEVLSVRWSEVLPSTEGVAQSSMQVELTDGTVLPADQFLVDGSQASATLPAALSSDNREPHIPLRHVSAVQLRSLDSTLAEQWSEIRSQEFTSDVLVVVKRDGKSLDYIEGIIGNLTEQKVEFKLDDEEVRVDRAKVAGLIYLRSGTQPPPEPVCTLHGRAGMRVNASSTRLTNGIVTVTTISGVVLKWPLEDIDFVDFSAGKILYLSDIQQATVRWMPLVGIPGTTQAAAKYGQPRRDHAAYGGPLTLALHTADLSAASKQLRSFNKGLALHSRTEMVFRLPAGYRQFLATAGIEPVTSAAGNVQLTIYGDDKPVFEASVAGSDPPREIELDVAGVKRLKLVVDFGKNLDTGDWLNLCDARLVK